jgi:hypothetical protein
LASKGICVNSNYLGEKHGKLARDQHFSIISYYLRRETLKNHIANTTDIAKAINSSQFQSNLYRRTQFQHDQEVFAFVLNPNVNEIYRKNTRMIQDITSFYNLQNIEIDNEFFLNSTVYSDSKDFIDPRFLNSVIDQERSIINYQGQPEIGEEPLNIDSYLKHKRQTIEILLNSVQKTPSRSVSINNLNQGTDSNSRTTDDATISTSDVPSTSFNNEQLNNSGIFQIPKFCEVKCRNCSIRPIYSIEQLKTINQNRRLIGQVRLNEELSRHGHPKSRKMQNNKFRNTEQALSELLEHYRYFHNLF